MSDGVSLDVGTNHVSVMGCFLVDGLWWMWVISILSKLKKTFIFVKLVTRVQTNIMEDATCCDRCTGMSHLLHMETL